MPDFHATQPLAHTTPLFGGRLRAAVPAELVVEPSSSDPEPIDYTVTMTLDVIGDRLQCVDLCVHRRENGPAVTTEGIRRIPVATYVRGAAIDLGVVLEAVSLEADPDQVELVGWEPPPADFAAEGMTDEALRQVSRVYQWAMATGDRPYGVLERGYGLPRAKASRWIATARRRGLLGSDEA